MAERIFRGTGRRKASVAQVTMVPGSGKITVNGRDVKDFFPYETNIMDNEELGENGLKIVYVIRPWFKILNEELQITIDNIFDNMLSLCITLFIIFIIFAVVIYVLVWRNLDLKVHVELHSLARDKNIFLKVRIYGLFLFIVFVKYVWSIIII